MLSRNVLIVAGIAVALLVLGYMVYPRRREGFQVVPTGDSPAIAIAANTVTVTQPPPNLVGDPATCSMFKNLIDGVNSQLAQADQMNYPGKQEILQTTKANLEQQYALLKCP